MWCPPPRFTGRAGDDLLRFKYDLREWWLDLHCLGLTNERVFACVRAAFPYQSPAQLWWAYSAENIKRSSSSADQSDLLEAAKLAALERCFGWLAPPLELL